MPGVPPKPPSKRRRRNVPASYGAAEPTVAPAAAPSGDRELGIENPHPLIASMWTTVQHSCESAFYGEADWARLRMELWYANRVMSGGQLSSRAWAAIQHGLSDLLVSPAAKRRCAIEMKPPRPDEDAVAAVSLVGRYRQSLKSV